MKPEVTTTELPEWGPKVLALSEKRRNFVIALYNDEAPAKGEGLLIYAARAAGYGNADGTSNNKTLSVIANRLVQDASIKEAIAEYSRGIVRAISPEVVRAVRDLVRDKDHKGHERTVLALLDRIEPPAETTHNVNVNDSRRDPSLTVEAVMQRIRELAREAGVVIGPPPTVIEGKLVSESSHE